MQPTHPPIGLALARVARVVSRGFDEGLAHVGGSLPVWLVLLNLKIRPAANQRELAAAIGIREATLTHHLNAMEADGLLIRRRSETNRRIHEVTLTDKGEEAFLRLREAAVAYDAQLRDGLSAREVAELAALLERLAANARLRVDNEPAWAGLAEADA
ncbi:MAG TPA: MarR family transcriptional regulator [Solirubrobacteraceae bacterium]|nr:MarR family transcriptional regulator [Solirubrobacteraceae bacterium]